MDKETFLKDMAEKGTHCPNCGSDDFSILSSDFDTMSAGETYLCYNCDQTWELQYELVGYEMRS